MSSILETFYILFESDTAKLEKGVKETKHFTDDLNTSLKQTDLLSNQVGRGFLTIARHFRNLLFGYAGVAAVFSGIHTVIDYSVALDKSAKALRTNTTDLDAWQNAVKKSGGDVKGFQKTLEGLPTNKNFAALGIPVKRGQDLLALLPRIAEQFSKLDKDKSLAYGKILGFDEPTILLLQRGRREVDDFIKRQKELGTVTKENTEAATKFDLELQNTAQAVRALASDSNSALLPFFTKLLVYFQDFAISIRKHKGVIIGAFIGISTAFFTYMAPVIYKMLPAIAILAGVTAAIIAFALAFEDVYVYFHGGKSFTGYLIKELKELSAAFRESDFAKTIISWGDGFIAKIELIRDFIRKLIKDIEWLKNLLTPDLSGIEAFNAARNAVTIASDVPIVSQLQNKLYSQGGSTSNQRNTSVTVGDVTINTQATDPLGIVEAFNKNLGSHLNLTNGNFDDGVAV